MKTLLKYRNSMTLLFRLTTGLLVVGLFLIQSAVWANEGEKPEPAFAQGSLNETSTTESTFSEPDEESALSAQEMDEIASEIFESEKSEKAAAKKKKSSVLPIALTPKEIYDFRIPDLQTYRSYSMNYQEEASVGYELFLDAARLLLIVKSALETQAGITKNASGHYVGWRKWLQTTAAASFYPSFVNHIFHINSPLGLGIVGLKPFTGGVRWLFGDEKSGSEASRSTIASVINFAAEVIPAISEAKFVRDMVQLLNEDEREARPISFIYNRIFTVKKSAEERNFDRALKRIKHHFDLECRAVGAVGSTSIQYIMLKPVKFSPEQIASGEVLATLDGHELTGDDVVNLSIGSQDGFYAYQRPLSCLTSRLNPFASEPLETLRKKFLFQSRKLMRRE